MSDMHTLTTHAISEPFTAFLYRFVAFHIDAGRINPKLGLVFKSSMLNAVTKQ